MISQALVRDIRKAVRRNRYEMTPGGVLFPDAKVQCGGIFEHNLNGGPWKADPNLLPTQGRNAMLDIALGGVAKQSNWYMPPFAANVDPTNSLTAANFAATQTEFTNYTEGARALWTPAAASSGVITNAATLVQITIGAGSQFDMYGLALISASAKSATTGVLAACTLFKDGDGDPDPRLGLHTGDVLGLRYTITLTST